MPSAVLLSHRADSLLRRSAVPTRACRTASRTPLRVVAFRDAHRAQQLTDAAKEFAKSWSIGELSGGNDDVFRTLEGLCDPQVTIKATHPLGCWQFKGLEGVKSKFAMGKHSGSTRQPEVILAAANDATDTAFCLIKFPSKDGKARDSHILLKMDILLDDGARRVTNLVERGQVSGDLDPAWETQAMERLQEAENSVAVPFPRHLLKPWANKTPAATHSRGATQPQADLVQHVERTLESWIRAQSTGMDIAECLKKAGCDKDLQVFDGYGCLPLFSEAATEKASKVAGDESKVEPTTGTATLDQGPRPSLWSADNAKQVMEAVKAVYDIDCRVVDCAVCLDEAAAFTHWTAKQRNKRTGVDWTVEGMEVDILDPATGALRAVYLFRDPMDFEEVRMVAEAYDSQMNKMAQSA